MPSETDGSGADGKAVPEGSRRCVDVALALVWDGQGRVLICKRKADAVLGGYWEFPGGKCKPGEATQACAIRETLEETGLLVRGVRSLTAVEHEYAHARVRLEPFVCHWISGELEAREVAEARWVTPGELGQYRFPEANGQLLQAIRAGEAGPK